MGTLPTAMNSASFPSCVLKSRLTRALIMSLMSFRKTVRITINVPTCSITSKISGGFISRICCVITRCAELDTGNHSVKPWMTASITASINVTILLSALLVVCWLAQWRNNVCLYI